MLSSSYFVVHLNKFISSISYFQHYLFFNLSLHQPKYSKTSILQKNNSFSNSTAKLLNCKDWFLLIKTTLGEKNKTKFTTNEFLSSDSHFNSHFNESKFLYKYGRVN